VREVNRMRSQRTFLTALMVSLSLLLVFCGCEHKKGIRPLNERPGVKVSGGPPNGGTAYYAILIHWFGWDDDSLLLNTPEGVIDPASRWSEPTSQTSLQFQDLAEGIFWQFGVRAVDEAGAIEPGLKKNRNVIFFKITPNYNAPRLYVYEGYGQHLFPGGGPTWKREAGLRGSLIFSWRGDASLYGGTISSYIYGVDIEDLSDPEQWEGERNGDVTSATVHFDTPGPHYFYVKVKDNADTEQLAIVELEILDFEFDRDILYVDDYFDIVPSDPAHDNFRETILGCARAVGDTVYVYNCCIPGPNNQPPELPDLIQYPSLSEISRYRLVI
jgi:hypothetical protein